jgi:hypothetical protein
VPLPRPDRGGTGWGSAGPVRQRPGLRRTSCLAPRIGRRRRGRAPLASTAGRRRPRPPRSPRRRAQQERSMPGGISGRALTMQLDEPAAAPGVPAIVLARWRSAPTQSRCNWSAGVAPAALAGTYPDPTRHHQRWPTACCARLVLSGQPAGCPASWSSLPRAGAPKPVHDHPPTLRTHNPRRVPQTEISATNTSPGGPRSGSVEMWEWRRSRIHRAAHDLPPSRAG